MPVEVDSGYYPILITTDVKYVTFAYEIDRRKSLFQFRQILRFRFAELSIKVSQHFLGLMFAFPEFAKSFR